MMHLRAVHRMRIDTRNDVRCPDSQNTDENNQTRRLVLVAMWSIIRPVSPPFGVLRSRLSLGYLARNRPLPWISGMLPGPVK